MPKKKFYSLCRYVEKTTGNVKIGYMPREGFDVPNDLGFDLAVYRAKDSSASTNWNEVKTWFVVDTVTGLSVAQGDTKKQAADAALSRLETLDKDKYRKAVMDTEEKYGPVPIRRIIYNFLMN
jgi:hypothetical protein